MKPRPANPQSTLPAFGPASGANAFVALLLAATVLVSFRPALDNGFVRFDDTAYITQNPEVLRGLSWEGLRWAFSTTYEANWHPLTWLSHMLDVELYELAPRGHHLTSLLLHAGSTVLLFLLLRSMTGDLWRSAMVAALFGIHPLRVESVAWAASRKDVLSGLFFLLALLSYLRYVRRRTIAPYAALVLLFACGLMAKPVVVTLPFQLLLLDFWPLGRLGRPRAASLLRLASEKLPLFALAAVASVVTYRAQQTGRAMEMLADLPFLSRLANAFVAYTGYLRHVVWPLELVFFYPHPGAGLPVRQVVASALLLALCTVAALLVRRRRPWLAVGWLLYLGSLVPMIGLVQVGSQAMADRYTYLPLVGIFMAIAWTGGEAFAGARRWRPVLAAVAVLASTALMKVTMKQTTYWKDSVTLYTHALAVSSRNWVAEYNLGVALAAAGRTDAAEEHYRRCLSIKPDYGHAHGNLGLLLLDRGLFDEAILHLRESRRLRPGEPVAIVNLAGGLARAGRFGEAATLYQEVLLEHPGMREVHVDLGVTLALLGRQREAADEFTVALQAIPADETTRFYRGRALLALGDPSGAAADFREALRIRPDYEPARLELESLLRRR